MSDEKARIRQQNRRQRLKEQGIKPIYVTLSPEALAKLQELRESHVTIDRAINHLLVTWENDLKNPPV